MSKKYPTFHFFPGGISSSVDALDIGKSETQIQISFFKSARDRSAYDARFSWIHAIPNGGSREKKEAAILKASGVTSGVSDVFVPVPLIWDAADGSFGWKAGLYMEFKTSTGEISDEQYRFLFEMEKRGYAIAVVFSSGGAMNVVESYMKTGRGNCTFEGVDE